MYFEEDTLDDLMRCVLPKLLCKNLPIIKSSRGKSRELRGCTLKLTNPLARLSRSEERGLIFSKIGELLWYLSGSDEGDQIGYYISAYKDEIEGNGKVYGAYGPRLFKNPSSFCFKKTRWQGQFPNVLRHLQKSPDSRRAVIQLFDRKDIDRKDRKKDVPCTCNIQFLIREEKLDVVVFMRSNDAWLGLPHDVFAFTMLQEIACRHLNVKLGQYWHMVGSLHLYEKNREEAKHFTEEWQRPSAMPEMPVGDLPSTIVELVKIEEAIRLDKSRCRQTSDIQPYWRDILILLEIFRLKKEKNLPLEEVQKLRGELNDEVYHFFVENLIKKESK